MLYICNMAKRKELKVVYEAFINGEYVPAKDYKQAENMARGASSSNYDAFVVKREYDSIGREIRATIIG